MGVKQTKMSHVMRYVWFVALGLACLLTSGCGTYQRDDARILASGSVVAEGPLTARAFKSSLVQMPGKQGYLMLREAHPSLEFKTFYAASLGPESEIISTWNNDLKKAIASEQITLRIGGRSVKVYFVQLKRPLEQALEVMYAWIEIEGRGCKVELNEIKPRYLLSSKDSDARDRMAANFKQFAESIRLKR